MNGSSQNTPSIMLQLLGVLLIINSLIGAFWWISQKGGGLAIGAIAALAVFAGIFLIINERATEITIKNVGTIKAAAQRASSDAKEIAELRDRVAAQAATIDLVAKDSADAKTIVAEVKEAIDIAEQKVKEIEGATIKASNSLDRLERYTDFNSTVIAAQNDDRKAFDQLKKWADDQTNSFHKQSAQAWEKILNEHASPIVFGTAPLPWNPSVDPSKISFPDLRAMYETLPPYLRPALINFIWSRVDFSKRDRMQFLIDTMQSDSSLAAVETAARIFSGESKQEIKPLAIWVFLDWWNTHKDEIQ